jgi:hypothetical protein
MNKFNYCIVLLLLSTLSLAQNRKEAKKNKLKTLTTSITENGKTIYESKLVFDANGNQIEKTHYNKEGQLKSINRIKYNEHADEIEDLQYDANNKLVEKKIIKYNTLESKTEEQYFDGLNEKH